MTTTDFSAFNVLPFGPLFNHRTLTTDEAESLIKHVNENTPDLIGVVQMECGTYVFKAQSFDHITVALLPWADIADFGFEEDEEDNTIYAAVLMRDERFSAMSLSVSILN
jgi:hypothetical protein